jgi:rhodanese-related sulfurtransferase/molybdopterin-guanine dinucleotide biosynthesis protein A
MGRDKALVDVGGRPLAAVAARALAVAGAVEVVAVGGDVDGLRRAGLAAVPDDEAGLGPVGGILTALRRAPADPVAVLACDLPAADPAAVAAVVGALAAEPAADAAVAVAGGRRQWLFAAWRRRCAGPLAGAVGDGVLAVHRAVAGLVVLDVAVPDPAGVADADTPDDLAGVTVRTGRTSSLRWTEEVVVGPVPEIDVETLAEHLERGAYLLDVRQPDEYADGHVPGAHLVPLGQVPERAAEVPADRPVYVMCRSGSRSQRAAEFLRAQGVDAVNVTGGMLAWADVDGPVARGDEPG